MAKKNNDKLILQLKAQIEAKELRINNSDKFRPVTNCVLPLNGINYNLHVADKNTLMLLIVTLESMKEAAAKRFPDDVLNIGSFTADEWLTDLEAKYITLNIKTEKNRLQKLKDKLTTLLSTEKKVELELKKIISEI